MTTLTSITLNPSITPALDTLRVVTGKVELNKKWQNGCIMVEVRYCSNLLVNRKSSKAQASSGHMVSNFPREACWRATGRPVDSTFNKEETASLQVLSDGQAYFMPRGNLRVCGWWEWITANQKTKFKLYKWPIPRIQQRQKLTN